MAFSIRDDRLSKIPTELLLEITSYLDKDDQWSFAWAFPSRPQLMLPILKHLSLSNYHPGPGGVADITNILDFLYRFPEFVNEIHHLIFYMESDYPIRNFELVRYPLTTEAKEVERPEKVPCNLLSHAAEGEFTIMQWLSKRVEVNEDHLLPWATADEFQQAREGSEAGETVANIAKLAVLLALGTNIRKIHIVVPHKYQTGCDLAHAAALAPAFRCFRHRGQILDHFGLLGDERRRYDTDMYHRNLGTFLSSLFVVGRVNHLELKNIIESMCHRGEWSLYTGVVVDRLTIISCVLRYRTFPRLLHAVNGLQRLDAHFNAPKSEHQLCMRPRLMHGTRAPDRKMIRNDVQRGLKLHCRTLKNLEIRNFPIDLSFLINTTRFYLAELRLKGKELSLTPLRTLPQSVHTLILSQKYSSTWLEFLALLVVDMKQQNLLPNLMHIIEQRPKLHMPKLEQDIRSLGIQFLKCERPVTKDYDTAFRCQGECGLTRAGNLKHENW